MFKQNFLPVSKTLFNILKKNINKNEKILEIGCASAHISSIFKKLGFDIKGIEIREDTVIETKEKLLKQKIDFEIITGDILNHKELYDVIWCSGLIQCWNDKQKELNIEHFSKLAAKGIFFVPKRNRYLPPKTNDFKIAVNGCEEFPTGNIPYILSKYYKTVNYGIIPKEKIKMDIDFIYYICTNTKT